MVLISMPFVYLIGVILFVFQPWFIAFEYQRASFPPDPYGFTNAERFEYGSRSIRYITAIPESSLAEITGPNGSPIYQESELAHMADVRRVFQGARWAFLLMIAVIVAAFALSWRKPAALQNLFNALKTGSLAAIISYMGLTVVALTAFEPLFFRFHQLFFAEGTWLFHPSDTLIRLFPKQLWIDAFIIVGAASFILALLFYRLFLSLGKRVQLSPATRQNAVGRHPHEIIDWRKK